MAILNAYMIVDPHLPAHIERRYNPITDEYLLFCRHCRSTTTYEILDRAPLYILPFVKLHRSCCPASEIDDSWVRLAAS